MTNLSIFTKNSSENSNDKSVGSHRLGFSFEKRFEQVIQKKKLSKDYQFFGIWIAQNLGDTKNIPLFIRLAKNQDKYLLEHAVSYTKDYPNARSRTHLFLWFLKGKLKKVKSEELILKSQKRRVKKSKVDRVELIGKKFETIPDYRKLLEDQKNIENFFVKENIENETQILNPKDYLFDKLNNTRKFENNILKNYYLNIFKFDIFADKTNLAIDIIDERDLSLSKKAYFESKKKFALKNNLKYILVDAGEITSNYSKVLMRIIK